MVPPEIVSGEAFVCSWWVWVAIAYIYQHNQTWYGWSDNVPFTMQAVIALAPVLPDTSGGARFLFSRADLGRRKVMKLIGGMRPKARFG